MLRTEKKKVRTQYEIEKVSGNQGDILSFYKVFNRNS